MKSEAEGDNGNQSWREEGGGVVEDVGWGGGGGFTGRVGEVGEEREGEDTSAAA